MPVGGSETSLREAEPRVWKAVEADHSWIRRLCRGMEMERQWLRDHEN